LDQVTRYGSSFANLFLNEYPFLNT